MRSKHGSTKFLVMKHFTARGLAYYPGMTTLVDTSDATIDRLLESGDLQIADEHFPCPDCGGTGKTDDEKIDLDCLTCEGSKRVSKQLFEKIMSAPLDENALEEAEKAFERVELGSPAPLFEVQSRPDPEDFAFRLRIVLNCVQIGGYSSATVSTLRILFEKEPEILEGAFVLMRDGPAAHFERHIAELVKALE
jgi:hypothetical protein